jgi:alpha-beta hydrolase superfamily lysophospholipase
MKVAWLAACALLLPGGMCKADKVPYPVSVRPPQCVEQDYQTFKLKVPDKTELIVHQWAPKKARRGRPVVLFIHGIGMHGAPYASVAAGFTSNEVTLVVPDLRGHGRSGKKHGELDVAKVLANLDAIIDDINARHRGCPVVLAGESMGALLAADYARQGQCRIAGLALLAPAFKVHPAAPRWGDLLGVDLDANDRLQASTRDKQFIAARRADKLALHKVDLRYLTAIGSVQMKWPKAAAELDLPLFVGVAGKDKVIDGKAVKDAYDLAVTCKKKTWRKWGEAYHTLCWDPNTPRVIEELVDWALKECSEKAPPKNVP